MQIRTFRYQCEAGQIKICVNTDMPCLTNLNGFVFQIEKAGCRVFFLRDDVVVAQRVLMIGDVALLKTLLTQKVMRIEDHSGDAPVAFVAVNRRLLSKTPLSTLRPAPSRTRQRRRGTAS